VGIVSRVLRFMKRERDTSGQSLLVRLARMYWKLELDL